MVFHLGGTVRDVISNKNSSFLTQTIAHGTKNWIYCTLRPFKEYAKYGIGFDFTFDAHQRCRQIYNLFVYSFDLRKGEDKYVTTLTSSFMFFWHQSEARPAATVWSWSGKTLSPGALLAVLYFSSFHIYFSARLDFPSSPLSALVSPRMGFKPFTEYCISVKLNGCGWNRERKFYVTKFYVPAVRLLDLLE